jgi:hypothetical protein
MRRAPKLSLSCLRFQAMMTLSAVLQTSFQSQHVRDQCLVRKPGNAACGQASDSPVLCGSHG